MISDCRSRSWSHCITIFPEHVGHDDVANDDDVQHRWFIVGNGRTFDRTQARHSL